ncbi:NADH-quinone oxidoreductase subunit E [Alkalithermobacter thermoalcaliphilus JW-YL-7 = DSM 7308]|uniref:NADH dehydrogenase (Ubiquinone) 24 kDa subunit n=1 Tax=Alkalithermobacter thermoalcaliphilus JW-YL-7 = DSM 7308 TaxID=1121328 RepID=A0A150FQJ7_CLOPD|nr:NADH dehydrogenase (ubiquinone) 24 kDa subunit [[Clostridium] paradoxum JW-YL-7 = DSM 7308]SHK79930.1 NADH-quinone oxidoreductase subunit E [[Clostridium] paradoxum JW-YL-7 = DSM 7308]
MDIRLDEKEIEKFKELDEIIDRYSKEEGMLIRILQKSQELFGYLPVKVQAYISEKLNIPISTINGVVSFYSLFSQEPQGKYTIGVCMGTACYVKGSQDILNAIKEELQIDVNETSMDQLFTLKATRCIGACGLAPVITINEDVYGNLSPSDIPGILYQYIKQEKTN